MSPDPLVRLRAQAGELGISSSYRDVFGAANELGDDALVAVAGSLLGTPGASAREVATLLDEELAERRDRLRRSGEPVIVAWLQHPQDTASVELPATSPAGPERVELAMGYHRFSVGGTGETTTVLVAPRRLPQLPVGERWWGLFAPIWWAWDRQDHTSDLTCLAKVSAWMADHGGRVLGTLPLLSTYLDHPWDPSPYTPVSRRWWNENHIDMAAAGEKVNTETSDPTRFDAARQWARVRPALGRLAARAWTPGSSEHHELSSWVLNNPGVESYGRFRATIERQGTGWRNWPGRLSTELAVPADDPVARTYTYAQWKLANQLGDLADTLASRDQLLYLDLALGSHSEGFDTWERPGDFAWGVSVGAPPDALFRGGQDWGFPPVHPHASRFGGHEYFAACLRAHMQVCDMLRIDHVMGLFRLFLVPAGMSAREGAYVRYPAEELLAVLSVEAHRAGVAVVGENLGTVPAEVDRAMVDHGLYGMHVHQLDPGGSPGPQDLASVNTHDTPTFAAWAADQAQPESYPAVAMALARSAAPVVVYSVDDLVGETEPQNVPGTGVDRPNWVVRSARPMSDLSAEADTASSLDEIGGARSRPPTGRTDY